MRTNINTRRERPAVPPVSRNTELVTSAPLQQQPFYPNDPHHATPKETSYRTNGRLSLKLEEPNLIRPHRPQWLSVIQFCLRISILILTAAVVGLLAHTLDIYHGTSGDTMAGQVPTWWPTKVNLTPSYILFSVGFANFCGSVVVLAFTIRKQFAMPMRWWNMFRVCTGIFAVVAWAVGLTAFRILEKGGDGSLEYYACKVQGDAGHGQHDYRMVCKEQNASFYIALASGIVDTLLTVTLAINAFGSKKLTPNDPEKD
ncbi:hypothetical protein K432DRAFT_307314 [Lepidopterella palustris CBS 459.81]|uniref:MARVEL domain-containing protein n=1 Tax=Lepidopterella palustris CBS 459.81 TaxID=1314670 RepID=A0A8E2E286_9PEZI|nr:hypothetical protein K432DRAFT_307314 [Lepidopterella palustris CBS 459.81]